MTVRRTAAWRRKRSRPSSSTIRSKLADIGKSGEKAKSKPIEDANVRPAAAVVDVADQPVVWENEGPPSMPRVAMSQQHAATCLVNVGQTMPEVALKDLEGRPQQLSKLLGERLTVVVVWSSAEIHSPIELNDLAVEVASPMAARGVRVVGVNERDGAETARKTAEAAGVDFPILLDGDGKFFAQLATERLPRTYLVDGAGKVLWLDIEYSRITHHDLRQAIRFVLNGT